MAERPINPDELEQLMERLRSHDRLAANSGLIRAVGREPIRQMIHELQAVLFPNRMGKVTTNDSLDALTRPLERLIDLIHQATDHDCHPANCSERGNAAEKAGQFLESLIEVQQEAISDVDAAYEGDPAARNFAEIISTYPGFYATLVYRLAHRLHLLQVPLLPRMMTELAHSDTGIDIHPGAVIGQHFFIDHGTGVVIGETTEIGDNVTLYQGVTLGALNFPHDGNGRLIRGTKRHPTIEHDVVIYSEATILGGNTIIGHHSVIGGNVWLTEGVPPFSKVTTKSTIALRTREDPVT